jgi:uncharacterized protein (DUF1501 family)
MPGLQELFNTGRAAIVANVGPLVAPTTLEQYESFSVPLPPQLFSHNDQQDQWHSLKGREVSKSGWAGRIADVLAGQVTHQKLALNVSLAGQTLYQAGAVSVPYTIGPAGPTPFLGLGTMGEADLRRAFESVANADYDTMYERAFATVQQRALEFGERVSTELAGAPQLASLPDNPQTPLSPLATQLRTVAKLIATRDALQMSRQIFFVAMGGFDTHDDQNDNQPGLLSTVSDALKRFDDAMQQIGVSESVVAFTESDFGRTLTSNGDGTDHGWGGIQVVTGGAVAGGRIYGEYPLLRIGARVVAGHRADDVGAGSDRVGAKHAVGDQRRIADVVAVDRHRLVRARPDDRLPVDHQRQRLGRAHGQPGAAGARGRRGQVPPPRLLRRGHRVKATHEATARAVAAEAAEPARHAHVEGVLTKVHERYHALQDRAPFNEAPRLSAPSP